MDDGGPAFPGLAEFGLLFHGQPVPTISGMSLRDWLAGQLAPNVVEEVMRESYECKAGPDVMERNLRAIPQFVYRIADGLIAERQKKIAERPAKD